jgi:hypothetical protein
LKMSKLLIFLYILTGFLLVAAGYYVYLGVDFIINTIMVTM